MTPADHTPAERWPVAGLDTIGRGLVLAASIPSAAWEETVLDAPYDVAWPWISSLERSVPAFDTQIQRIEVRSRTDEAPGVERLQISVTTRGVSLPFDVRLEDGYCLMRGRGRHYLVIMAAVPDGDRTRYLHVEAVPLPGTAPLRPVIQRVVRGDMANLRRLAAGGFRD